MGLAAFLGVFLAAAFLAGLAVFLAAGLAAFLALFLAAFLGVLAFLAVLAFLGLAVFFLTTFLAVFFLTTFLGFSSLPSLKDPLTAMRTFFSTKDLSPFLMKGASLATSTLLLAAMCFLMAAREDPLRSFNALTAATIMTVVLGWVGLALGFAP